MMKSIYYSPWKKASSAWVTSPESSPPYMGAIPIEKANGGQFDLLLTDLYMLDPNGIRLTQLIRQIMPDIEVIWMTASTIMPIWPGACM